MDLSSLNPAQHLATVTEGHVLATACPGSGKTRMLVCRAIYFLQRDPRAQVAAVTFTKDAANELRARIAADDASAAKRVITGTFHALCGRQLRMAGFKKEILNDNILKGAIYPAVLRKCGSQIEIDDLMRYVAAKKTYIDSPLPPFEGYPGDQDEYEELFEAFSSEMARRRAIDYGDMIREAVIGMRAKRVAPLKVRHLLVDEFQDTDYAQLQWVLAHAAAGATICVVGDDDQSIYGWRGGMGYEGLVGFRDAVDAKHVSLETTYRCATDIVATAGRLIAHNKDRVAKTLTTQRQVKGEVHLHELPTREAEAKAIVDAVLATSAEGDPKAVPPASWVVLARTNAQLDVVEDGLKRAGITHQRLGGPSLWDSLAAKALVGLLNAVVSNRFAPLETVCTELFKEEVADAVVGAIGHDASLDAFAAPHRIPDEPAGLTSLRLASAAMLKTLREFDGHNPAVLLIKGVELWLRKTLPPAKLKGSKDSSRPPLNAAVEFLEKKLTGSLESRLRWLDESKPMIGDAPVTLMTMHRSKGLEYENVWIIGCEDGVCPSAEAPIEEERRLFYVAMTRAKTVLHCSYVKNEESIPSPFVEEAKLKLAPAMKAAA